MAGTISRGIKAPIIRQGDDIVNIVVDSVLAAAKEDNFELHEKDVVCVTEAVVARADGNYATTDDIAEDVRKKLRSRYSVHPDLSRRIYGLDPEIHYQPHGKTDGLLSCGRQLLLRFMQGYSPVYSSLLAS